jgi:hypothetical protein
LLRTDFSKERIASIIRVTGIGKQGTRLAVTSSSVRRLLVTANVVPSSPTPVTLMIEAIRSSETAVLTRATRRNIPEEAVLHSIIHHMLRVYYFNKTGMYLMLFLIEALTVLGDREQC